MLEDPVKPTEFLICPSVCLSVCMYVISLSEQHKPVLVLHSADNELKTLGLNIEVILEAVIGSVSKLHLQH